MSLMEALHEKLPIFIFYSVLKSEKTYIRIFGKNSCRETENDGSFMFAYSFILLHHFYVRFLLVGASQIARSLWIMFLTYVWYSSPLGLFTEPCWVHSDFEILAFPCNQFLHQEPQTEQEIKDFACTRFKAEFPIFQKVNISYRLDH